jgi:hypothetical protein
MFCMSCTMNMYTNWQITFTIHITCTQIILLQKYNFCIGFDNSLAYTALSHVYCQS